jgi:hypothetical protein
MSSVVANHILSKNINSFQKLYFLLFLYHHPDMQGTSQEFAERSYLGNTLLIDQIMADLHQVGLVDQIQNTYQLHHESDLTSWLRDLDRTFQDPLARQELLSEVKLTARLYH